jgi:flagellar biosynthetic protein FlhB
MAEESLQDKTEAPTPRKRQDAREKGNVPKSQEVTTAFILLTGALVIQVGAGVVGGGVRRIFLQVTGTMDNLPGTVDGMSTYLGGVTTVALGALAPMVLTLAGMALAVTAVQARGVITAQPLIPKWDRLDPIAKAKQIWGTKAIVELLKSFAKLILVTIAVWFALDEGLNRLGALGQQHPAALLVLAKEMTVKLLLTVGLAYLAIALLDYGYTLWKYEKDLKMTKEEVKKELKDAEGDQVLKVRRRTFARSLARRRMMIAVSEADVVVTNPTHIAVALKYDPEQSPAPIVLAMGERKVAQKIKEIARENGIPTIENKPLARALLATATIGQAIPVELFVAVAEVLAWVIRTRQTKTAWAGSGVA